MGLLLKIKKWFKDNKPYFLIITAFILYIFSREYYWEIRLKALMHGIVKIDSKHTERVRKAAENYKKAVDHVSEIHGKKRAKIEKKGQKIAAKLQKDNEERINWINNFGSNDE